MVGSQSRTLNSIINMPLSRRLSLTILHIKIHSKSVSVSS